MRQNLTAKQKAAAEALAIGSTISRVSVIVGVSRQTLHRWLKLPPFLDGIEIAGQQARANHAKRLLALTDKALSEVEGILDDPNAPPSTKVRAAEMVLTHNKVYWELSDLEKRITALEQKEGEE